VEAALMAARSRGKERFTADFADNADREKAQADFDIRVNPQIRGLSSF
jgi:hypothetical protein